MFFYLKNKKWASNRENTVTSFGNGCFWLIVGPLLNDRGGYCDNFLLKKVIWHLYQQHHPLHEASNDCKIDISRMNSFNKLRNKETII